MLSTGSDVLWLLFIATAAFAVVINGVVIASLI